MSKNRNTGAASPAPISSGTSLTSIEREAPPAPPPSVPAGTLASDWEACGVPLTVISDNSPYGIFYVRFFTDPVDRTVRSFELERSSTHGDGRESVDIMMRKDRVPG